MTEEQQRQYQEALQVRKDLDEMFVRWADRDANGLVVCTVMLLQFVAMAGHMFEKQEDYDRFINESVARGRARFKAEIEGTTYVH
jgi:hypothetical protein